MHDFRARKEKIIKNICKAKNCLSIKWKTALKQWSNSASCQISSYHTFCDQCLVGNWEKILLTSVVRAQKKVPQQDCFVTVLTCRQHSISNKLTETDYFWTNTIMRWILIITCFYNYFLQMSIFSPWQDLSKCLKSNIIFSINSVNLTNSIRFGNNRFFPKKEVVAR